MKQIVANFKTSQTPEESKKWLVEFLARVDAQKANITLCLPYTSLAVGKFLLDGTNINLGAQNICDEEGGSTGEISGKMLVGAGVNTVIVGHSDRRAKFKENGRTINKKIKIALKNRLNVILCVGETLTEKNTLKTLETLKNQLEDALKGLYENELERVCIVYEPVWAIGIGKSATIKEIEFAIKAIRSVLADDFSAKAAKETKVLYGGSVSGKNITSILHASGVNGVMLASATEDSLAFAKLVEQA